MPLSDAEIMDVILASAASTRPMSDETVRRLGEECGHDPDALCANHHNFLKITERKRRDGEQPMPWII